MASQQRQALVAFIAKRKFLAEGLYTGATNEGDRSHYESVVNALAVKLLPLVDQPSPKQPLMAEFKAAFPAFELADTEERERAIGYFEEIMTIFGIASSDGVLDKLLYGFSPNQPMDERNREALAAMSGVEQAFAAQLGTLTRSSAISFLRSELGQQILEQGGIHAWARGGNADDMVSVTEQAGKVVIIWMVKGRFVFSRLLP